MTSLPPSAALDVLVKEIAAALPTLPGSVTVAGLLDAAHWLRRRADLVRSHLQFLLADTHHLTEAAKCSYWHVNGFVKMKMASDDRFCLRLHIWPAGTDRRGDIEPHSHRWDFASWVAVGPGLLETYFTKTESSDPAGSAHVHYDYGREAEHEPRLQSGPGLAWLRPVPVYERPAGTVYDCTHQVIHTVAPRGSDLIATVLLQGPTVTDTTPVYRPYGHQEFRVLQRSISRDELAALIGAVEEAFTAYYVV